MVCALAGCSTSSDESDAAPPDGTDAAAGSTSGGDPGTTTGATGTGTGGMGTTADTGGDGSTGETSGGLDPAPPEVIRACETPSSTIVETFEATGDARLDGVRLAYTPSMTAMLYAESTGERTWTVWMQRLDADGVAVAQRLELAAVDLPVVEPVGPAPRPWLSLTAIEDVFVACWTGAGDGSSVGCASVLSDGAVTQGLQESGRNPAVALGPAGVGLVYTRGNDFVSRRLGADALPLEEPRVVFEVQGADLQVRPELAGTSVGYVAAADLLLPRFDEEFRELEGQSSVGWTSLPVSVAGSADVVAAAYGSLDGVQTRILTAEADEFSGPVRIDGLQGNTSAATTTIARADESFAALWSVDLAIHYAALDLGGELAGEPLEILPALPVSDSLALAATQDGFLAAAVMGSAQEELTVFRLDCP